MAQAATKTRRGPRSGLTRAQRRAIRDWRSDLGHAIWDLNESSLVQELRRMYETKQPWPGDMMIAFSEGIEKVVLIALEIRHELSHFLKKGGVRRGGRGLPKPQRERLEGALEGIWLGVGYLRNLTPEKLSRFIDEHLGEDFELAEMLFFGFCPISVETTRDMPRGARIEVLEDQVEQLRARERVAKALDLKGMADEAQKTRRKLQNQLKRGQSAEVHESGGCYLNGMKALRGAVMQLFYTLQAKDIRRIKLTDEDSDNWHDWLRDMGEPPPTLVDQMQEIADDEGRVLHVFDKNNELLREVVPLWYAAEDPESLAQRSALKQSKRARQRWGYDYRAAVPADVTEFYRSLKGDERRRVTEFLKRHPDRQFKIVEIAELAGVPVHVPAESERFRAAAAAQFRRNPDDVTGIQDATDATARNIGLITALWNMDLTG